MRERCGEGTHSPFLFLYLLCLSKSEFGDLVWEVGVIKSGKDCSETALIMPHVQSRQALTRGRQAPGTDSAIRHIVSWPADDVHLGLKRRKSLQFLSPPSSTALNEVSR